MWTPGYVEVVTMMDSAYCPDPLPADFRATLVYAGGSSATHAWDAAELARVAHMPRLPCWVPTPGHEGPLAAAEQFLAWLKANGVPSESEQGGRPIHVMWDMETGQEPDAAWLNVAADLLAEHGYWNLVYGSLSTLFGQPERDGYMVANPTGVPHMFARAGVKGTQYTFNAAEPGGKIDEWYITAELASQLWMP